MQDALEPALAEIAGSPAATTCAGRTDRGVHARKQVVHFDTEAARPAIRVGAGRERAPAGLGRGALGARGGGEFHARYSARSRTYRLPAPQSRRCGQRSMRSYIGWFHLPLDIDAMRAAAALLVGEHDFSAFRSSECQAKSPVTDDSCSWQFQKEAETICFVIRANAFLHHMVRNLVGTLVYVGKGSTRSAWVRKFLLRKTEARPRRPFGPEGLYLEKVEYEARWGLPAVRTRVKICGITRPADGAAAAQRWRRRDRPGVLSEEPALPLGRARDRDPRRAAAVRAERWRCSSTPTPRR